MSAAFQTTFVPETGYSALHSEGAAVNTLLQLQAGMEQHAGESAVPSPAPLEPAGLQAFYLLRKDAGEAYLSQFRQMRSRLSRRREDLAARGQVLKTLAVTSPADGDGKTFVALNLALMLAVAPGSRVLVADVNLRRPAFHQRLFLPEGPGIREAVAGAPWRSVVRAVPHMGLYIACLGQQASSRIDPFDFLELRKWLHRVQNEFDWMLLDGPSLGQGPDGEGLSHLTDGTLLVLRPGQTPFDEMDRAIPRLNRSRLAGVIFNGRP